MSPCRDVRLAKFRRSRAPRRYHSRARRGVLALALSGFLAGCSDDGEFDRAKIERALLEDWVDGPEAAKDVPKEQAPKAPQEAKRGDLAVYTIAYGGTLINVANLYKLHHHEIVELNPGIEPERELPRGSEVVVYRNQGDDSESIGHPHDGMLVGAMPMLDGPGRKITAERWKTWGTRDTVLQLDRVLTAWAKKEASAPPVLVGNLSARTGGNLPPHKTHQSGRDVDLSYITHWDGKSPVTWQHTSRQNLDAKRTWRLLKLLVSEANIDRIFIDRSLQRILLDYARKHGTVRKSRLNHWLEVAGGRRGEPAIVQHVPGHKDHLHVRFACPEAHKRCL